MTEAERMHLVHILGMLGSEHQGERAAAAAKAEAFRRKHGLTWEEMINGKTVYVGGNPPGHTPEPTPEPAWSPPPSRPSPAPGPAWTPPAASNTARWVDREGLWLGACYLGLMAAPLAIALLVRLFN
jgi:hypothetical protein